MTASPLIETEGSLRLSIIVPVYNGATYVAAAIDSVLGQAPQRTEVVVVDDGSTDETPLVLRQFAGRIRVLTQPNAGLANARNAGLRAARGRYVGFLDSDDLYFDGALSALVDYLDKNTQVAVVAGAWDYIDPSGRRLRGPASATAALAGESALEALLWTNVFPVHAAVLRRAWALAVGGFDEGLGALEDYDFWLRLALAGARFASLPTPVARYRQHDLCMTRNWDHMERNVQRFIGKWRANCDFARAAGGREDYFCALRWLRMAAKAGRAGNYEGALRYTAHARPHLLAAPSDEEGVSMAMGAMSEVACAAGLARAFGARHPAAAASFYCRSAAVAFGKRRLRDSGRFALQALLLDPSATMRGLLRFLYSRASVAVAAFKTPVA